jgi:hypothetical protein
MWRVKGTPLPPHNWPDPWPVNVLYDFDGPRIFTCKDRAGSLYLAYRCA